MAWKPTILVLVVAVICLLAAGDGRLVRKKSKSAFKAQDSSFHGKAFGDRKPWEGRQDTYSSDVKEVSVPNALIRPKPPLRVDLRLSRRPLVSNAPRPHTADHIDGNIFLLCKIGRLALCTPGCHAFRKGDSQQSLCTCPRILTLMLWGAGRLLHQNSQHVGQQLRGHARGGLCQAALRHVECHRADDLLWQMARPQPVLSAHVDTNHLSLETQKVKILGCSCRHADSDGHYWWEPQNCRLRRLSGPEARQCFRGRHIFMGGDSLTRWLPWTGSS